MPWPQSTDYNLAIQNPGLCFRDEELRACTAYSADPVLGLPTPRSGNFADVYRLDHPKGNTWAVKCFTREVGDLQDRYAVISAHLDRDGRPFIVEFRYLPDAILVDGLWYPIVKMRWVEGKNLSEFLAEQADRPSLLDKLSRKWLKLASELREARIGHGDLQHGNVLLVPNPQRGTFSLRLIDYDGMYVPALADRPSRECGFPGYQHPQRRQRNLFGPEVDRFSHLVIYTALRAVRAGGSSLWSKFGSPESLLFTESDFTKPTESELLRTLFALPDADLRHLLGHLVLAALGDASAVPLLEEIVPEGIVNRLDVPQFERLRLLVGPILGPRRTRMEPPAQPSRPDDLPPLPAPLRRTRVDSSTPASGTSQMPPVARRLDDSSSLPDWMLPEALPNADTVLFTPPEDDSDPDVPILRVPPLLPVLVPAVERQPPPVPQMRPVLIEETAGRSGPHPERSGHPGPQMLPHPFAPDEEEIFDAIEVLDEPTPAVLPPPERAAFSFDSDAEIPEAELLPEKDWVPNPAVLRRLVQIGFGLILLASVAALAVVLVRQSLLNLNGRIQVPAEITLEGGQELVLRVNIEPGESVDRAFVVRLVGLPETIQVQELPMEADNGEAVLPALFHLSAGRQVSPSETTARVQLYRSGVLVQEKPLRLVVRRPNLPQLIQPLARRRIEIGGNKLLTFEIDRCGRTEPVLIEFVALPTTVTQKPTQVEGQGASLTLNINVSDRQAVESQFRTVRLLFFPDGPDQPGIEVDRAGVTLEFALPRPTQQYLTTEREGARVEVGRQVDLPVWVNRKIYKGGDLRLTLRNLPPGVTAEEIEIPTVNTMGTFRISANGTAQVSIVPAQVEIIALEYKEQIGRLATSLQVIPASPRPE